MSDTAQGMVTVEFDHHSSDLAVDPYAAWTALRNQCPVTWSKAYDGFWVLTDYATVAGAARDDDAFRSGPPGAAIPHMGVGCLIPLETDAPVTQQYRRILQQQFSPAAATAAEPLIRQIAHEIMDGFIERGEVDFVNEFSRPLPARFTMRITGFDEHQWPEYTEWIHAIVHRRTSDPEAAMAAAAGIYGGILETIEARRAEPSDDLVSDLLRGEIDGRPLDEEVLINYVLLLLLGGLDTTSAAMGNALVRLQRQPELRRQLLAEPDLLPNAVEEFLRIDAPVQALARTLNSTTEMCGQTLQAEDRALLSWAAANRDPTVFASPDVCDFRRDALRHVSFGVGLHRCLGSNYGRTMFRIMLEIVLQRTPDFEIIGNPDEYRLADTATVWGHERLPAHFTPGSRRCS